MTMVSMLVAAALAVPAMPAPEHDDCEVVTNCMFDASRRDGMVFSLRMALDAAPSNGVEIVFGRDADGDGVLSRTEEALAVGCDCGTWKVIRCDTGDETACAGAFGRVALDWKLRLDGNGAPWSLEAAVDGQPVFAPLRQAPPPYLFDPAWNAAKVLRRGPDDPHPHVSCALDADPIVLFVR